ncbi:hypothetical protein ACMA1I_08135 [Pontibacter sp. 13R65]|uniref:hypothetical protein n=1 Tax=Pontibacter sp. 13R65 TaxID=3127458 RepID=UPI00301E2D50
MEYSRVHYWHYLPEQEEEEILESALSLSKKARHDSLLNEIALFIYQHTGAQYVLIGRLSDTLTHMHSLVFIENGLVLENFTYPVYGTPCYEAVSQKFCYYPCGVTEIFPEDEELKTLQIESYLGTLILSEDQEQIGLTVLMDQKQIANPAFAEHLVTVLSPAIEEEIKTLRL